MLDLSLWQALLIALIFLWSGFVRSGLGFGGALLAMPFILLVDNRPIVYLPIIGAQLLFFVGLTFISETVKNKSTEAFTKGVDWIYLRKAMLVMLIPKLIGVAGLVVLPNWLMSSIIFTIVLFYSLSYISGKAFSSRYTWLDTLFLMLGAYISGTSLIGAPLLMAVFVKHVSKEQLRSTVFVLWFILVVIKMTAFIILNVDLQLQAHLWLLPAATIGHYLGLALHNKLMQGSQTQFFRAMGIVLLLSSIAGLFKEFGGV